MKRLLFILSMAMMSVSIFAKEIKTMVVTTTPQMHCAGCENKIKNGLKYEKGIKDIMTNLEDQTVTIKYDADKTDEATLTDAFKKIGYSIRTVAPGEKVEKEATGKCENMKMK